MNFLPLIFLIVLVVVLALVIRSLPRMTTSGGGDREIEWQFALNQDEIPKMKEKLVSIGATREREYLMPVVVYNSANGDPIYIRLRHEGNRISFTVKKDLKAEFPIEYEVDLKPDLQNMDQLHLMLTAMGCTVKYRVEKIREIWRMKGAKEIVFDRYPGVPTYMEIDTTSEQDLRKIASLLGLGEEKRMLTKDAYNYFYGIPSDRKIPPGGELGFNEHAKEQFIGKFQKDEDKFDQLLAEQIEYVKKLKQ